MNFAQTSARGVGNKLLVKTDGLVRDYIHEFQEQNSI